MYNSSILKTIFALGLVVGFVNFGFAQDDDLLKELDSLSQEKTKFEPPAFKALQIGNIQSTKIVHKGDLYLIVAHRFGSVKGGIREFYGLDQANTKIQFLYGVSNRLQLGISRDSYEKTYSGTAKLRCYQQSDKMPINLVLYTSMDINTLLSKNTYPGLLFFDRFAYTTQILASRRFSEKLSLEIAPIYVRQNVVDLNFAKTTISNTESLSYFLFPQPWNQLLLAVGGRYKLTKRLSVNMDYAYNFSKNKNALYQNPLTMGMDIETGGHVFQLLFTNSRASNDGAFLTEALGDWSKGDISFGFNILRVF
jgi:hypothetical protein